MSCMLLLAQLALSCSDGPNVLVPEVPEGMVVRLVDVAEEVSPADRTEHVLLGHRVESLDATSVSFVGESSHGTLMASVRPASGSEDPKDLRPAFIVRGEGVKRVVLKGEIDRQQLCNVVATVSCYGEAKERARIQLLDRELQPIDFGPWQEFEQRREPTKLVFEYPRGTVPDPESVLGGIKLEFEGAHSDACGVLRLDALGSSMGSLSTAPGAAVMHRVGGDIRAVAGLVEGSAWRVQAHTDGKLRLHASLHWPTIMHRGGAHPTVVVEVDGTEVATWAVDERAVTGWQDESVELGDRVAKGSAITLHVEDDDDGHQCSVLIGDGILCAPQPAARTVLLITSDTHRADHLGAAAPESLVRTPALDALARRGLYFTDCISTTNVTNPSHVAIMTGWHPRDSRVIDNTSPIHPGSETLAEQFQRAGYRTFAAISTQHLGPKQSGLGQGFDRFETTDSFKRAGHEATATINRWLDQAKGEPVFVWLHVFDAHAPYDAEEEVVRRYYDGDPFDPTRHLQLGGVDIPDWIQQRRITDTAYVNALYKGEIDTLDGELQQLLERPRTRAGIVAFTADHGESLDTHGIYWDHAGMAQPVLQVPLILAGPGVPTQRTAVPVQTVDLARTLVELAGLDVPFRGRNLLDALEQPGAEPRFALSSNALQASITTKDWHLILDLRDFQLSRWRDAIVHGRVQLFDRRDGINSEHDRAGQEPDRVTRMREALIRWLEDASDVAMGTEIELSEAEEANLEALGYGGIDVPKVRLWWTPPVGDGAAPPRK